MLICAAELYFEYNIKPVLKNQALRLALEDFLGRMAAERVIDIRLLLLLLH